MDDFLNKLRPNALFIKLNSKERYGGGVDMNTLLDALHALNDSYQAYVETNFRQEREKSVSDSKTIKIEIKKIQDESDLIVVDLKFESFGASISPNIVTDVTELRNFDVNRFKKSAFQNYKKEVMYADYDSPEFLKTIENKYTDEQRREIFAPIIVDIINNPKIKSFQVGSATKPNQKTFRRLRNDKALAVLAPKPARKAEPEGERLLKAYFTVSKDEDLFGQKAIKRKNLRYAKEVAPDTYPFTTDLISYEGLALKLNQMIDCDVEFVEEDKLYFISFDDLHIEVWGENRAEAEDAFHFTFYQLYQTYYLEDDKNLTPEAIELKLKLKALIKEVADES